MAHLFSMVKELVRPFVPVIGFPVASLSFAN